MGCVTFWTPCITPALSYDVISNAQRQVRKIMSVILSFATNSKHRERTNIKGTIILMKEQVDFVRTTGFTAGKKSQSMDSSTEPTSNRNCPTLFLPEVLSCTIRPMFL
jgi:hypothetical protein